MDDNDTNLLVAKRMLQQLGYDCVTVKDGKQAVDIMSDPHTPCFAAILMDQNMPIMDGFEATAELRRRGFRLPIIAMTANVIASERGRCIAAGMNDYLSKPVNKVLLASTLERCINASAQNAAATSTDVTIDVRQDQI